jgi:hypothetical protein
MCGPGVIHRYTGTTLLEDQKKCTLDPDVWHKSLMSPRVVVHQVWCANPLLTKKCMLEEFSVIWQRLFDCVNCKVC